jgi:hypothetical protein
VSHAANPAHSHGAHAHDPHVHAHAHHGHGHVGVDPELLKPPPLLNRASAVLLLIGAVGIIFTLISGAAGAGAGAKHALISYHMGVMYALGLALGSLGFVMIAHQTNAGWSATVRRQFENIASCIIWVCVLLAPVILLEVLFYQGKMFKWMNPALTDPASPTFDVLANHKKPFLNPLFFTFRFVLYFGVWIILSTILYRNSRRQDQTGDTGLTKHSRFISSFGLMLFALTAAFAAFDYLMSLDFHFFSTMWGVYFFAGSILSAVALVTGTLCVLKLSGKLGAAFTQEHLHDLSKLIFAFSVFWAYVTFSQYFLIWYSNIPEETAWFWVRKQHNWEYVGIALSLGQFIVPFLILLFRPVKRSYKAMAFICVWVMAFHALDIYYIVRPILKDVSLGQNPWVDVAGILGPLCIFLGLAARKAASGPLIPLRDPRLSEALHHRNYV